MSLPHRYPFRWLESSPDAGAPGIGAPGSGAPGTGAPGSGAPGSGVVHRHRLRLSGTAHLPRRGELSPIVALEILAQAAASTAAGAPNASGIPTSPADGGGPGLLAAIDNATFAEELVDRPLMAGDELDVEVEQTAAFGRLLKVRGSICRRGALLINAQLVLTTSS